MNTTIDLAGQVTHIVLTLDIKSCFKATYVGALSGEDKLTRHSFYIVRNFRNRISSKFLLL